MRRAPVTLVLVVAYFRLTCPATAGIVNGSFESGFDGWTVNTEVGATAATVEQDPAPDGDWVARGSCDTNDALPFPNDVVINQQFSATADQTLVGTAFAQLSAEAGGMFAGTEHITSTAWAMVSIDSPTGLHVLWSHEVSSSNDPPETVIGPLVEYESDDWETFSYSITDAGMHTVTLAMYAESTYAHVEAYFDHIHIIPEPSTLLLLTTAALALLAYAWRRRRGQ